MSTLPIPEMTNTCSGHRQERPQDTSGARQPYTYRRTEMVEPDWRKLPAYKSVTPQEWRDPKWQRKHSVTTVNDLHEVFGSYLPIDLANSIEVDRQRFAT